MNKNVMIIGGGVFVVLLIGGFIVFKSMTSKNNTSSTYTGGDTTSPLSKANITLPLKNKKMEDWLNDKLTEKELIELRKWIFNWTSKWHPGNESEQVKSATWEMMRKDLLPSYPDNESWEYFNIEFRMEFEK